MTSPCSWRDLPGGEQVLAAVLDPLHRRTDLRRREHQAHLLALHHDLLAEPAAGVAHDDADAVLGHPEQAGAEEAHLVRRLRRRVDRELAGRARPVDDQAAPFHRHRRVRLLVDRLAHDVGGRREHVVECGGGQAGDLADDVRAVALVHERVGVLGRRVVDDRRQRLVVDVDELGRVLGEIAALGDHERDRVADEADLALGERRARRLRAPRPDRRVPLLLHAGVQVGGGEHEPHARRGERRRRVDPADRGRANGLRTK